MKSIHALMQAYIEIMGCYGVGMGGGMGGLWGLGMGGPKPVWGGWVGGYGWNPLFLWKPVLKLWLACLMLCLLYCACESTFLGSYSRCNFSWRGLSVFLLQPWLQTYNMGEQYVVDSQIDYTILRPGPCVWNSAPPQKLVASAKSAIEVR